MGVFESPHLPNDFFNIFWVFVHLITTILDNNNNNFNNWCQNNYLEK